MLPVDQPVSYVPYPGLITDEDHQGGFTILNAEVGLSTFQWTTHVLPTGVYFTTLDVELIPWGSAAPPVWDFSKPWTVELRVDDNQIKILSDWIVHRTPWNTQVPVVRVMAKCVFQVLKAYLPHVTLGFRSAVAWNTDVFASFRLETYWASTYVTQPSYQSIAPGAGDTPSQSASSLASGDWIIS